MSDPASPVDRIRDRIPVRRALLSVSDKTGLVGLATALTASGVELVSTGSTAATVAAAGLPVTEVAELTGFPESLDGRVKTLHPAVHAGLLADLRRDEHARQLDELGIRPFELVVVNLYPFVETVASGAQGDEVVEQIDIGGPAMVRATAKNHANAAIVVDPARYAEVVESLAAGGTTFDQRRELAAEAFAHTAAYDRAVADWFAAEGNPRAEEPSPVEPEAVFGPTLFVRGDRVGALRYGENSHQTASLYAVPGGAGIAQARQLHGKEMSFNNYVDADAALRAAFDLAGAGVAIVKHANPCGVATAATIAIAHRRAHECDPVSAFGGVIAANRRIDLAAAESIADVFTEVVVAPGFDADALAVLSAKKNIRLLELPDPYVRESSEIRQISGGLLAQQTDRRFATAESWTLVAGEPADAATLADLEFAWVACRSVKSNAILLASGGASVGIGMGQVNRVDSCRLAVERAAGRAAGSVAASDAFFPFRDGPDILISAGVRAIVHPGGSVRDQETIDAAAASGISLYLTGERHFFH